MALPYTSPECQSLQLATDASQYAVGACLHQMISGKPVPVAFFSKKISEAQRKYSAYDRELLAAYYAVLHFKPLIDGRTVTLFTDHKPLVSAFLSRVPAKTDRQQRHLTCISEYIHEMHHIKGQDNVVSDTLSRDVNTINTVRTEIDPIDLPAIAAQQLQDPEIGQYEDRLEDRVLKDDIIVKVDVSTMHPRPFVPRNFRQHIFDEFHNICHPGVIGTTKLIAARYFWPDMKRDIKNWVNQCLSCQAAKVGRHTRTPVMAFNVPVNARFECVSLDVVGPLPVVCYPGTNIQCPNRYLLTCIDRATRWIEATPIPDIAATTIAYAFLEGWVSRFSVPLYVLTDQGKNFESELFYELSTLIGFHRLRTSGYHAQSNGFLERRHRTIKTALMARGKHWLSSLPVVLWGLRAMPDSDGISPSLRVTGKTPLLPRDLFVDPDNPSPHAGRPITKDFIKRYSKMMKTLDFTTPMTFRPSVKPYVPPQLRTCPYVWLRIDRTRRSLEAPYEGPYRVRERTNKTFVIEREDGTQSVVSIDRLKPCKMPVPTIFRDDSNPSSPERPDSPTSGASSSSQTPSTPENPESPRPGPSAQSHPWPPSQASSSNPDSPASQTSATQSVYIQPKHITFNKHNIYLETNPPRIPQISARQPRSILKKNPKNHTSLVSNL